jgi:phosphosulfolactate phosphohydrolase-like enzyme
MTIQEIQKRVDEIAAVTHDDETAHGREDKLRADFIAHVRTNPNDPELSAKAALVLSTDDMNFARWCA